MIYLVTKGEYSDFGVVAAFTKEEDAKQAVADGLGNAYEKCPLDAPREKPPEGMNFFHVNIALHDGSCWPRLDDPYGYEVPFVLKKASCRPMTFTLPDAPELIVECWAKDETHAAKIANEQRAQFIANPANSEIVKAAKRPPREPIHHAGQVFALTKDDILNDRTKAVPPLP